MLDIWPSSPAGRTATALFVASLLAIAGCTSDAGRPSLAKTDSKLLRENKPVIGPTTLNDRHGWRTVVWLSAKRLCNMTSGPDENEVGYCGPTPSILRTDGPPALLPGPDALNSVTDAENTLFVGMLRGPAAKVEVTVFGTTTVSSPVVRLRATGPSTPDNRVIGAYAVWLPVNNHPDSALASDVTKVVARDANGRIIARIE